MGCRPCGCARRTVTKEDVRFWLAWIAANSVGEMIGLGATFALGVGPFSGLTEGSGVAPALLSAGLMTATGALEGFVVGLAQWLVLRRVMEGVGRRSWIVATVLGAVAAWLCASVPMAMMSLSASSASAPADEPPQALILLFSGGLGLVAGLILSAAQWRVLRRHVARAWRWLPANGLAWAAGMPLIFAAVDLAQRAGSVPGAVLVMAAGIALAGAVVGAIHGAVLLSLLRSSPGKPLLGGSASLAAGVSIPGGARMQFECRRCDATFSKNWGVAKCPECGSQELWTTGGEA